MDTKEVLDFAVKVLSIEDFSVCKESATESALFITDCDTKYILVYRANKNEIYFELENLKAKFSANVYTMKEVEKFLIQVRQIMNFVYFA
jgi:hypothetical protein